MPQFTDDEILLWLDEQLPAERMVGFEQSLRDSEPLRNRVAQLAQQRDQGAHSVGEIWRRNRLSCPSRTDLGSFLLEAISPQEADYIQFHLDVIGCRFCSANLEDLQQQNSAKSETKQRRQKFFQSSAGYLRNSENREKDG